MLTAGAGGESLRWSLHPVVPAPPEAPGPALSWRQAEYLDPDRPLTRHPLLLVAEQPVAEGRGGGSARGLNHQWLAGLLNPKRKSSNSDRPRLAGTAAASRGAVPFAPGNPLVVLVVGGKGGCGRTTFAIDLADAFCHVDDVRQVLLVDADGVEPDIDVRVGAFVAGRDLMPSARLDELVLRFAELHEGRLRIESCLWSCPGLGFQTLLAPRAAAGHVGLGREHLDYLWEHFLAPSFDVVIVDGGPATPAPALMLQFFAERATRALVPIRSSEGHLRSCRRTLAAIGPEAGLGRGSWLAVVGTDSHQVARSLQTQLGAEGMELEAVPWAAAKSALAESRHLPRGAVDRGVREAFLGLALRLVGPAALGNFVG